MENFNNYNEQEINWQKSVSEISKFILDHLDKVDFYNFIKGEAEDEKKEERWSVRLAELKDKATKRLGHQIDEEKLLKEAYLYILRQKERGELVMTNNLELFCSNIEELIKKIK